MVQVIASGRMETNLLANLRTMRSRVGACSDGATVDLMKDSGRIVRCTELEPSSGQMDVNTKANMIVTSRRAGALSNGQPASATKENGFVDSNMERENFFCPVERPRKELGTKANRLTDFL